MKLVNVRIKYGGQVMTYDCGGLNPSLGDWVVVKSGELTYLGQVVTAPLSHPGRLESARGAGGPEPKGNGHHCPALNPDLQAAEPAADAPEPEGESGAPEPGDRREDKANGGSRPQVRACPGRRMLRLASEADLARQAENELREKEAFEYCLSRVAVQGLEMKLVAVEVLMDGSKTIFYYTAEERVDFRQLVKELVSRFRTRIEMRQIGVRHEARMVGGLGQCGRCFCCSGFLSNFAPVSVKMAKEQNISLSPSKISGVCGRLMCCLAFEHSGPAAKGGPKSGGETDQALRQLED